MESVFERIIAQKEKSLAICRKELAEAEDGTLHMRKKCGKNYYWEYNDGKQKGITTDKARIYRLARKEFMKKEFRRGKQELKVLKAAEKRLKSSEEPTSPEIICKKYGLSDISRIIYSDKALRWIEEKHSQNPYKPENLRYTTDSGVLTRSKSERTIANIFEKRGLIYRTEPEILIDGRKYYPDFMILCPDGRTVIWEHCGLMDNNEYFYRMFLKINEYRKIGYVQHRNLVCTFEEDLEEMDCIEEIIERFIFGR